MVSGYRGVATSMMACLKQPRNDFSTVPQLFKCKTTIESWHGFLCRVIIGWRLHGQNEYIFCNQPFCSNFRFAILKVWYFDHMTLTSGGREVGQRVNKSWPSFPSPVE